MYAIKHDNGTYYAGPSGIGPRFGATLETAERFRTKREAMKEMGYHWAFASVPYTSRAVIVFGRRSGPGYESAVPRGRSRPVIVTLSETTRGLDGWFTTATPEGGEPIVLLLRHGDVEDYQSARTLALRWVWKTWPDAVVRRAEGS